MLSSSDTDIDPKFVYCSIPFSSAILHPVWLCQLFVVFFAGQLHHSDLRRPKQKQFVINAEG